MAVREGGVSSQMDGWAGHSLKGTTTGKGRRSLTQYVLYKVSFPLGLLPLKTDVNVPTVSNKQKNLPVGKQKLFLLTF